MLKARALKPGDRLAAVAPASSFDRVEFDRGMEEVRKLGFEPVYNESVFERTRYVAGTAAERAAALREAWTNPEIAGVIGVRGGDGRVELFPLLAREEARRARKTLIGDSDLASILNILAASCRVAAIHGPP